MRVLIIEELDLEYNERDVIGVASSPKIAEEMIAKYYGEFEVSKTNDVSEIPYFHSAITINVLNEDNEENYFNVSLRWFEIDKI